jgi:hypothetical protein
VSIAMGIPCRDGIVLACDHQYTIGFTKIAGPKLFPGLRYYDTPYNSVLVVAVNNPESGKKLSSVIVDSLPESFTLDEFVESAEAGLRVYLDKYINWLPEKEQERLFCDFLVAATYGQQSALYRANGPMLVKQEYPVCIGEGLYIGNYLLNRLLPAVTPNIEVCGQIATHIITVASDYINSIGKGISLHVLSGDGSHRSLLKPEREVIQTHFEGAFKAFADLLSCCDGQEITEAVIDIHINRIKEEIESLRHAQLKRIERRKKMAERMAATAAKSDHQSPTDDQSAV